MIYHALAGYRFITSKGKNTVNIQARAGQIIGRDHILRQANCQDNHALIQTEAYTIGVVCDGCGEGLRSEVGSALGAEHIAALAQSLLNEGTSLEKLPALLYKQTIKFLKQVVKASQPINEVDFIKNHLLFTALGIIATQDGAVMFSSGDGTLLLDNRVMTLDQHNTPAYIAYHLIDPRLMNGYAVPDGFEVYTIPENWRRLAAMSDGFEPELLPQVWNIQHTRGLQRKLNVWSNQERRFKDDATIITVERI